MSAVVAAGTALWLGVLTSISPCLMATNVAAVSFLARRADNARAVLLACAGYILGHAAAFVLLAMILSESLLSVPTVSHWLQKYMFRLLGPLMILCGMVLLELISVQLGSGRLKGWAQSRVGAGGAWAAAGLGLLFAMSFCPTTAALFFGSLVPLAVAQESSFLLPLIYSLGVALPVVGFSIVIALAAHRVGALFARVQRGEGWARRLTGAIFLMLGLWFTVRYTLGT